MKKILASVLAFLLILAAPLAMAEAVSGYDELVVGSATAMSGSFFTEMWGNNTADADVRQLLHGYNMMEWKAGQGNYGIDNSVVSGIAAYNDAQGNRTYTIALYDDLYYSDGTPITAYDYAFSILLSVSPEVAAVGGAVNASDHILGAEDYRTGKAQLLSGVHVPDAYVLTITVQAQYLPYFYEMALLNYCPSPIHVIAPGCAMADDGQGVYICNADASAAEPVFTAQLLQQTLLNPETGYISHPSVVSGPYELVSYDAQAGVAEFEINEYYKGNSIGQLPLIPRLVFRHVDGRDAAGALARGEIDLVNKCTNAAAVEAGLQLVSEGGFRANEYARSGLSMIGFCCERPAVSSQAVRQAVAHCFDKEAFAAGYLGEYGRTVDGYYGVGQYAYQLVSGSQPAPVTAPAANAGEAETAAYEARMAEWNALSLSGLKTYAVDPEAAAALLTGDGWTLNRAGGEFDPAADDVRCKNIGGELVALELSMIYPEGNEIEACLPDFAAKLEAAGVLLKAEAVPFADLLKIYYRQSERSCDMIYLATNFAYVFDPSATFAPDDAWQGVHNRTGIADQKLYELAADMRRTEPGDLLTYCRKWLAFQEYWTEVLPAIPVYSNNYFDFHTSGLQNYAAASDVSWSQAVIGASLGDAMP